MYDKKIRQKISYNGGAFEDYRWKMIKQIQWPSPRIKSRKRTAHLRKPPHLYIPPAVDASLPWDTLDGNLQVRIDRLETVPERGETISTESASSLTQSPENSKSQINRSMNAFTSSSDQSHKNSKNQDVEISVCKTKQIDDKAPCSITEIAKQADIPVSANLTDTIFSSKLRSNQSSITLGGLSNHSAISVEEHSAQSAVSDGERRSSDLGHTLNSSRSTKQMDLVSDRRTWRLRTLEKLSGDFPFAIIVRKGEAEMAACEFEDSAITCKQVNTRLRYSKVCLLVR